jgi:predicted ATP-dependent protease
MDADIENAMNDPDEDLRELVEYSIHELNQLKHLFTQSLDHYKSLLNDIPLMASLKDGDLMALKLCLRETEAQIKEIDDAIATKNE